ncbi:MAG: hypothetical protein ACJ74Y_13100 [Bryobacteraceae bacterium]
MPLTDLARGVGAFSATPGAPVNSRLILQLQRRVGNQAVQRLLGVQRSTANDETVDASVESGIARASGNGKVLDNIIRQQMADPFGADFSGARVHTASHSTLRRKCAPCGENGEKPGIQRMYAEHEREQSDKQVAGSAAKLAVMQTGLAQRGSSSYPSVKVHNFAVGILSRQRNPWFECMEQGVPCPPVKEINGSVCRMIGCYRAKTASLPFAVSPGVCFFRCENGSLCSCVLVGSSTSALCTFTFCDSSATADTQEDLDNLGVAALDAYQQHAPAQTPSEGPAPDSSSQDPSSEEPEEATA